MAFLKVPLHVSCVRCSMLLPLLIFPGGTKYLHDLRSCASQVLHVRNLPYETTHEVSAGCESSRNSMVHGMLCVGWT